jgi:hypothetical protein
MDSGMTSRIRALVEMETTIKDRYLGRAVEGVIVPPVNHFRVLIDRSIEQEERGEDPVLLLLTAMAVTTDLVNGLAAEVVDARRVAEAATLIAESCVR